MLCSGKTLSPKQKTTNKETGYSHSGPSTEEVEARGSGGKGLPEPQRELVGATRVLFRDRDRNGKGGKERQTEAERQRDLFTHK